MDHREDYSFCRGQMAPDEFVLWTGKPDTGSNYFTGHNFATFLFAIPFTAFAVFWMVTASKAPGPFFLFGIPFLGYGLYMLFGHWIRNLFLRKNTCYVITNKRIYRRIGKKTDNLPGLNMPPYETVMHKNGNGTIRFTVGTNPYRSTDRYGRYAVSCFTLDNLADVDRAQQAISRMGVRE